MKITYTPAKKRNEKCFVRVDAKGDFIISKRENFNGIIRHIKKPDGRVVACCGCGGKFNDSDTFFEFIQKGDCELTLANFSAMLLRKNSPFFEKIKFKFSCLIAAAKFIFSN